MVVMGKGLSVRMWHKFLRENGYEFKRRGKGTHDTWSNGERSITVSNCTVNRMVCRRECKEMGINPDNVRFL